MNRLEYSPFNQGANEIRLMTLLAGSLSDDIHVTLRKVPLLVHNTTLIPIYQALSYTWGSQDDLVEIIAQEGSSGQHTLAVTRNLATVLRCLRHQHVDRVLWIDAICINQHDPDERSSQVDRMADIYSHAECVIAWLGLETEETAHAFVILTSLASKINVDWTSQEIKPVSKEHNNWVDRTKALPFNNAEWSALYSLFSRSWFERLWIRQEILLASNAVLMCGFSVIPWQSFRNAVKCIYEKPRTVEINGVWDRLVHIEALVTYHGSYSLGYLIYQTRNCKCSDPRDRVYAVLSLLEEEDRKCWALRPKYTSSISNEYKDVSLSYMNTFQDLDLLRFCDINRREVTQDSPSWVADWCAMDSLAALLPTTTAHGNSSGMFRFSENEEILHATGLTIGAVKEAKEFTIHDNSPYDEVMLKLQHLAPPNILTETYHGVGMLLEAFCRTLMANDFGDCWDPPKQSVTEEEGRNTVRKIIASDSSPQSIRELVEDDKLQSYLDIVSWYCQRRALISTENGYIGVAPTATQPGDIVVVLLGCGTPLVLRPAGTDFAQYQVVGDCYLDGFMRTEAFLGQLPKGYKFVMKFDDEYGAHKPAFVDGRTSTTQFEDPRYQLLLGKNFKRRINFDNCDGEEDQNRILILESLRARGIKTQRFDLV